ncbi:MAG: NAD(P)/FAD-dependent oxidoreductase [Planctomycetes bacterium]|nr:NAD(P)/FAD-dependent oxidoreductase [Planctomycetota bacterium]
MAASPSTTPSSPFAKEPARGRYDAVVIGSGPNGLAAACVLAREGKSVLVVESRETIGGGMRSAELTLPGFVHDVCAAIHPMAVASPVFRELRLTDYGLEWIHPDAPVAHPLAGDEAVVAERSLEATAEALGADGKAWRKLLEPLVANLDTLLDETLRPLRLPRHPLLMARFGLRALRSARALATSRFRGEAARALFAGMAAHSILPLEKPLTSAVGLMLAVTAHGDGWPIARGGTQAIADALARCLLHHGGEIIVSRHVSDLGELPQAGAYLFDTAPAAMGRIAGDALPPRFRRKLERYRFGPGAFKLDWALKGPIPWRAEACRRAGTVHVGGTLDDVADAERAAWEGRAAERPFVLVAQQSLFDPSRAPAGKHTGWAYCHVPGGWSDDLTDRIEARIEEFAPGFRDLVLARHVFSPADYERYNPNYVGGDMTGGVMDWRQIFTRPTARIPPYTTPAPHVFICSASTPPGGGVHGMCGYYAARAALSKRLR